MIAPHESMLLQMKRQLEQELIEDEDTIWMRINNSIDEYEKCQPEKRNQIPEILTDQNSHKN